MRCGNLWRDEAWRQRSRGQVTTPEICIAKVCTSEVCTSKVCTSKVCASKVRTSEVRASEVCAPEVHSIESALPGSIASESCAARLWRQGRSEWALPKEVMQSLEPRKVLYREPAHRDSAF